MSAPTLAKTLALGMADGSLHELPRLTPQASPEYVRDLLAAYYDLRDALAAVRRNDPQMTLHERVSCGSIAAQIEEAIDDARRWLSRCARQGGRGLPPSRSGGSVPQAEPAVVMGHGCPAPSPAVGPAPTASAGAEHNLPDTPLFRACDPQGLQVENIHVDNRPIMGRSTHE